MKFLDSDELKPLLVKLEWAKEQLGEYNNRWNAVLEIPHKGVLLRVIASTGQGWDHVSVSLANRCPTWEELEHVRKLLFKPDEVVMQLHVPAKDHVNIHPNVLHLWRPLNEKIPLPPKRMV